MKKNISFKGDYAVSEVLGGVILLVVAVVTFSVIYMYFMYPAPDVDIPIIIVGEVNESGMIVLEHKGGNPLSSYVVYARYLNGTLIGSKTVNDDYWEIGQLRFPLEDIADIVLEDESDMVQVSVYCINEDGSMDQVFDGILHGKISGSPPNPPSENPMLISSLMDNTVDEDLICFNYTITPQIDALTYIYNWTVNGNSITDLILPFDTNGSSVTRDYSGDENTGTVVGPTWVDSGKIGGAYQFDGNDDHISLPYSHDSSYVDEITVEAWIKTTADDVVLVSFDRQKYWQLGIKNGLIEWSTSANSMISDVYGVTTINDNTWHYIVASYDSNTGYCKIYVDGNLDTIQQSHSPGQTLGNGDSPSGYIGRRAGNPGVETLLSTSFETTTEEDKWSINNDRTTWTYNWWEWWEDYSFGRLDSDSITPRSGSYSLGGCGDFDSDFVAFDRESIDISNYNNVNVTVYYSYKDTESADDIGFYYWDGSNWITIFEDLSPEIGDGNQLSWTLAEASISNSLDSLTLEFRWSTSQSREYTAIDDLEVTGVNKIQQDNYSGLIDELQIYNRALTDEQVYQNYLCTKDGLTNKRVIVSDETLLGEIWRCTVTPNDGLQDDIAVNSNTLQIVSYGGGT